MYIGGADTTVSSLSRFLLAMMGNPDEAQTEVDAVTGRRYRPDFEDESSVPSLPHYVVVDDQYKGYRIPAVLFYTTKCITPFFLVTDQSFPGNSPSSLYVQSQSHALGRIYIPLAGAQIPLSVSDEGYALDDMAIASVWIAVLFMLATFDVTKAIDEHGRVIEPSNKFASGSQASLSAECCTLHTHFEIEISLPLPFKCSIRPRPPTAVDLSLKLAAPGAVLRFLHTMITSLLNTAATPPAVTRQTCGSLKLRNQRQHKSLAGQTPDVYVGSGVPPILFEVNITMTVGDLTCNQMREIIRCRRWLKQLLGSSKWVA
ncbi:hypothetical protein B0H13DRAFT_2422048 [Mycena leptocephala]|nr:hypothetical protein B0H13DRAFT_2422048 [Mycena leptocephala]